MSYSHQHRGQEVLGTSVTVAALLRICMLHSIALATPMQTHPVPLSVHEAGRESRIPQSASSLSIQSRRLPPRRNHHTNRKRSSLHLPGKSSPHKIIRARRAEAVVSDGVTHPYRKWQDAIDEDNIFWQHHHHPMRRQHVDIKSMEVSPSGVVAYFSSDYVLPVALEEQAPGTSPALIGTTAIPAAPVGSVIGTTSIPAAPAGSALGTTAIPAAPDPAAPQTGVEESSDDSSFSPLYLVISLLFLCSCCILATAWCWRFFISGRLPDTSQLGAANHGERSAGLEQDEDVDATLSDAYSMASVRSMRSYRDRRTSRHPEPSMTASTFQAAKFKRGDRVRVLKESRCEGKLATVTNPSWNGLVKVVMDEADAKGKTKSFKSFELEIDVEPEKVVMDDGDDKGKEKSLILSGSTEAVNERQPLKLDIPAASEQTDNIVKRRSSPSTRASQKSSRSQHTEAVQISVTSTKGRTTSGLGGDGADSPEEGYEF